MAGRPSCRVNGCRVLGSRIAESPAECQEPCGPVAGSRAVGCLILGGRVVRRLGGAGWLPGTGCPSMGSTASVGASAIEDNAIVTVHMMQVVVSGMVSLLLLLGVGGEWVEQ